MGARGLSIFFHDEAEEANDLTLDQPLGDYLEEREDEECSSDMGGFIVSDGHVSADEAVGGNTPPPKKKRRHREMSEEERQSDKETFIERLSQCFSPPPRTGVDSSSEEEEEEEQGKGKEKEGETRKRKRIVVDELDEEDMDEDVFGMENIPLRWYRRTWRK